MMKIGKNIKNQQYINGLIFGSIVCISQINLRYGIPISLIFLLYLNYDNYDINNNLKIKILLIIKITIISIISLYFSNKSYFNIVQILSIDVILFIILSFSKFDSNFVRGMFYPLVIIFFCDFIYNINHLINSTNMKISMRPGDLIPRSPGILNSPIASVNIAFILFIYTLYFKDKILCITAFIASMATGALRAPVIFCTYLCGIIFLKYRLRAAYILILSAVFIASLYLVVGIHSNANDIKKCNAIENCQSTLLNGSALRMVAWKNAVLTIIDHPLHGYQGFVQKPFDHVDPESIINRGIAESTYLQYMVDWGVTVGALHILILLIIFTKKRYKFLCSTRTQHQELVTAALAYTCLLDAFFDSFFTSFIVLVYLGILIIHMPNQSTENSKASFKLT